ncbi:IS3 family transposase [Glutamicibacter ardleyensis]|uniref:IS3 family transposase n=1 Tax=Glutamicibacter ardleyensis TaxID=225894 RepID=UPI003F8E5926
MSSNGNGYDDSIMENSLDYLKSEMFHGERFADLGELRVEIEAYIQWYNTKWRQIRFKGMAPMEYRCHTLQPDAGLLFS